MFYGTIGVFHLYHDGTWDVTEPEEGVYSYAVPFDQDNCLISIYLELNPIPSAITNKLGTTKYAVVPLTVKLPVYDYQKGSVYYGAVTIDIRISNTGVEVLSSGNQLETIEQYISYAPYPIRSVPVSGDLTSW
jgi:YbbR domain-containing protein